MTRPMRYTLSKALAVEYHQAERRVAGDHLRYLACRHPLVGTGTWSRMCGEREGGSMYARVISVDVDVNRMDAGIEAVEKALQEVIKEFKGFAGAFLLVERDADKAIYMTLYETKEDADAIWQSGVTQDIVSKLVEFMAGSPTIEGYEVAIKA